MKSARLPALCLALCAALSFPALAAERSIHWYAANGRLADVQRMVGQDSSLVDARDSSGATPLMKAAGDGSEEIVAYLLAQGADPNAANSGGATALHYASGALTPKTAIADLLIRKGADQNARTGRGAGMLHSASGAARPVMVRFWLGKGLSVSATDRYGRQPIHYAAGAAWDVAEALDLLAAAGADINARDDSGKTPLALARERRNRKAVEAIEARGGR